MKAQPCYLLFAGDDHANASFCESVGEAKDLYRRSARPLWLIGQDLTATLHFVERQGDDWVEDPDRLLSLSAKGNVVMHTC